MALSGRKCPDCGRTVRQAFKETMTGRKVCPDCARAYSLATGVAMATGSAAKGMGMWAAVMMRIRRKSDG